MPGTIAAAAYLGERSHYAVTVAGRTIAVAAQNVAKAAARGLAPGDAVHLSWEPEAIVVLPAED
ncbi:MAG: TOBE domain-containing protein [Rhizomicrobium sp.]